MGPCKHCCGCALRPQLALRGAGGRKAESALLRAGQPKPRAPPSLAQVGADGGQANGGIHPAPERKEGFVTATFDLEELRLNRAG